MSRFLATVGALLLLATPARAQTTKVGSCSGMVTGVVGLAISDGNGGFTPVTNNFIDSVFGDAECDCNTMDVFLQIQLTQAFPMGSSGSLEMWVGTGCDTATNRTNASLMQCEKITDTGGKTFNDFVQGMGSGSPYIYIPIPARTLFSPFAHMCTANLARTNIIWLGLVTTDPNNPAGTCSLSPLASTVFPGPPDQVAALSGDSAITVEWKQPAQGMTQAEKYQVLCATADGQPIPGLLADNQQFYSQCVNGVISRRPFLGGSTGLPGVDGGIVTPADLGTLSVPLEPQQTPPDDVPDLGGTTSIIDTLDPRFICSGPQDTGKPSYSVRIAGLTNNVPYKFVVVAIKGSNATPSAELVQTPRPAEDLWRRLRNSGANPNGFCSVSNAPSRPMWLVWLLAALPLVGWLAFRIKRRA